MGTNTIGAVTAVTPAICYKDPKAAIDWLERAFGFDVAVLLTTSDGAIAHCEMAAGDFRIGVMGEWNTHKCAPALGGATTHLIALRIDKGLEEHCEQARKAGAKIIDEPQDQFYGDRTYRAADPEGNVWRFAQPVRTVSQEDMERASGLSFKALRGHDE